MLQTAFGRVAVQVISVRRPLFLPRRTVTCLGKAGLRLQATQVRASISRTPGERFSHAALVWRGMGISVTKMSPSFLKG